MANGERGILANTILDALPIAVGFAAFAGIPYCAWNWDAWSITAKFLASGLGFFLLAMQTYAYHYHAHTPFFSRFGLNRSLDMVYSVVNGSPFSFYTFIHLSHHDPNRLKTQVKQYADFMTSSQLLTPAPYVNNLVDFLNLRWLFWMAYIGKFSTGEPSGSKLFSGRRYDLLRRGTSQPLNYAQKSIFAPSVIAAEWLRLIGDRGLSKYLRMEAIAIASYRVAILAINPKFFFACFIPYMFFFSIYRWYSDYIDHVGVDLSDRARNSVSCYGKLFNIFAFNNGYHLEHHLYPNVHWVRIPAFRSKMVPESTRAVSPGMQWFSPFFRRRWETNLKGNAPDSAENSDVEMKKSA